MSAMKQMEMEGKPIETNGRIVIPDQPTADTDALQVNRLEKPSTSDGVSVIVFPSQYFATATLTSSVSPISEIGPGSVSSTTMGNELAEAPSLASPGLYVSNNINGAGVVLRLQGSSIPSVGLDGKDPADPGAQNYYVTAGIRAPNIGEPPLIPFGSITFTCKPASLSVLPAQCQTPTGTTPEFAFRPEGHNPNTTVPGTIIYSTFQCVRPNETLTESPNGANEDNIVPSGGTDDDRGIEIIDTSVLTEVSDSVLKNSTSLVENTNFSVLERVSDNFQSADHEKSQPFRRPHVQDALNYMDLVKAKFENQPQVYNSFLEVMKDFKSQKIDTFTVISRVSDMFGGSPELITGFASFLPPNFTMNMPTNQKVDGEKSYEMKMTKNEVAELGLPNFSSKIQCHNHPLEESQVFYGGPVRSVSKDPVLAEHVKHDGGTGDTDRNLEDIRDTSEMSRMLDTGDNGIMVISEVKQALHSASRTSNFIEDNIIPLTSKDLSAPLENKSFPTFQSQPLEFNYAVNYVNKIKNRFHDQPERYKQFLEILYTYQKEEVNVDKKSSTPYYNQFTAHEVTSQVAKLFENEEDLLEEFSQFLTDSLRTNAPKNSTLESPKNRSNKKRKKYSIKRAETPKRSKVILPQPHIIEVSKVKSTVSVESSSSKDIILPEIENLEVPNFPFLERVKIQTNDSIYDNVLRGFFLFNEKVLSGHELRSFLQPLFTEFPELIEPLQHFIGCISPESISKLPNEPLALSPRLKNKIEGSEEQPSENGGDLSAAVRIGASYYVLPSDSYLHSVCSGRTALCNDVLNDIMVCVPGSIKESCGSFRKKHHDDEISLFEDQRFELDVMIESNLTTITIFEAIVKKMKRMSRSKLNAFQLDDRLGGDSSILNQNSVKRLYGTKSPDIIKGLKIQPFIAIPVVLKRLKFKDQEWRNCRASCNSFWYDEVAQFCLKSKSLDNPTSSKASS